MAGGELPVFHQPLDVGGEVQEAQAVGDMAAALADDAGDHLLGMAEIVDQAAIGCRLLQARQVLALHILDDRYLQRLRVVQVADHHGDVVQLYLLGGAPPPLAGDDFILPVVALGPRPHQQRLDDAALADRPRQLGQLDIREAPPRLRRVGKDPLDRHRAGAVGGAGCLGGRIGIAEQRAQAPAELGPPLRARVGHHAAALASRRRTSPARCT